MFPAVRSVIGPAVRSVIGCSSNLERSLCSDAKLAYSACETEELEKGLGMAGMPVMIAQLMLKQSTRHT